eukprot:COSAG02_NODE_2246_length_9389_cov_9.281270_1_plen_182_part_10
MAQKDSAARTPERSRVYPIGPSANTTARIDPSEHTTVLQAVHHKPRTRAWIGLIVCGPLLIVCGLLIALLLVSIVKILRHCEDHQLKPSPICDSVLCQNNGVCVELSGDPTCLCGPGWYGPLCDIKLTDVDAAYAEGAASVTPEDGIGQADVDAAYAEGAASVTPEDGIGQADVDAAYAEGA